MDLQAVKEQALREFEAEEHKKAVAREKERLRRRANFWVKIFPWRLRIERRELPRPTEDEVLRAHVRALQKTGIAYWQVLAIWDQVKLGSNYDRYR